jgi:hypothetical protein
MSTKDLFLTLSRRARNELKSVSYLVLFVLWGQVFVGFHWTGAYLILAILVLAFQLPDILLGLLKKTVVVHHKVYTIRKTNDKMLYGRVCMLGRKIMNMI